MSSIDFLRDVLGEFHDSPAILWLDRSFTYASLVERLDQWVERVDADGVDPGAVVALEGDFSPNSIALLLALVERNCIVVPQMNVPGRERSSLYEIAGVQHLFAVGDEDEVESTTFQRSPGNAFYETLWRRGNPGLVLFSSGTSGIPKAAVHDFTRLLEKFRTRRSPKRTINFLLFDHWGGLNTMFHTLSNGGVVLTLRDRSPDAVCRFIEEHRVEILPASPTFLNLLLISKSHERFDLNSLETISYGTEPMPQSTLRALNEAFPGVRLQQTYGLIELGVLRSKSRSNDSLWVKVGGEGYALRVIDGLLQIKADSAMLGYLNSPSPFTEDGWFKTGDSVEVDGEYLKILGRRSELINVGGEKVFPAEVESVVREVANVSDVTVFGEKHALTGNIVCVKVNLIDAEDPAEVRARIKRHCRERLERFKVPVKIQIVDEKLFTERFKKIRLQDHAGSAR